MCILIKGGSHFLDVIYYLIINDVEIKYPRDDLKYVTFCVRIVSLFSKLHSCVYLRIETRCRFEKGFCKSRR